MHLMVELKFSAVGRKEIKPLAIDFLLRNIFQKTKINLNSGVDSHTV